MSASVRYCGRGDNSFDWEIGNTLHVSTAAGDDVARILGALSVFSIHPPLISLGWLCYFVFLQTLFYS
jgi:hypothetical protein